MMEFSYDRGKFLHRVAQDGTMESICLICFTTICRTRDESKLTAEELDTIQAAHVCEPIGKP